MDQEWFGEGFALSAARPRNNSGRGDRSARYFCCCGQFAVVELYQAPRVPACSHTNKVRILLMLTVRTLAILRASDQSEGSMKLPSVARQSMERAGGSEG